jgi:hypothetical protein
MVWISFLEKCAFDVVMARFAVNRNGELFLFRRPSAAKPVLKPIFP